MKKIYILLVAIVIVVIFAIAMFVFNDEENAGTDESQSTDSLANSKNSEEGDDAVDSSAFSTIFAMGQPILMSMAEGGTSPPAPR